MLVDVDLRADAFRTPPSTTTWTSHLVRPPTMTGLTVQCPDPNGTHTSHDIDQDTIRNVFPDLPTSLLCDDFDTAASHRLEYLRRIDVGACRVAAKAGPVFRAYLLSDYEVLEGATLLL